MNTDELNEILLKLYRQEKEIRKYKEIINNLYEQNDLLLQTDGQWFNRYTKLEKKHQKAGELISNLKKENTQYLQKIKELQGEKPIRNKSVTFQNTCNAHKIKRHDK